MPPITLAEFVSVRGQCEAARALGATQAAISKAAKSGRHIFVQEKPLGGFEAVELKGFPSGGESKRRPNLDAIVSVITPITQTPNRSVCLSSTEHAI